MLLDANDEPLYYCTCPQPRRDRQRQQNRLSRNQPSSTWARPMLYYSPVAHMYARTAQGATICTCLLCGAVVKL
jgi:hypothetical protein